jgi:adenylate kinase
VTTAGRPIILFIGAAGAGKGTQAERLARRLGLTHVASGDLFRAHLREGTDLGEQARAYMDRGELVPDDITIRMVTGHLDTPETAAGVILDGFPRTAAQAAALDETLRHRGEAVSRAVVIDVPEEELVRRLGDRWTCPTCHTTYHDQHDPPRTPGRCDNDGSLLEQRADDRPDVVRARLAKQGPPMREVIDHYERAGVLARVDGERSMDEVTDAIADAIGVAAESR